MAGRSSRRLVPGCPCTRHRTGRTPAGAPRGDHAVRPAWGWDENQCWTLARIAELVRQRFGVGYTLAGLDLLLHRIGWSGRSPARQAAERDEAAISAWGSWDGVRVSARRAGHGRLACCSERTSASAAVAVHGPTA